MKTQEQLNAEFTQLILNLGNAVDKQNQASKAYAEAREKINEAELAIAALREEAVKAQADAAAKQPTQEQPIPSTSEIK